MAEELFNGAAEALVRKALVMALKGDTTALKLCLERILPPVRERPVQLDLPALTSVADAVRALGVIAAEVADGELLPGEAERVARVIQGFVSAFEVSEIEQRLRDLEARLEGAK